jgi:hypothetical protein
VLVDPTVRKRAGPPRARRTTQASSKTQYIMHYALLLSIFTTIVYFKIALVGARYVIKCKWELLAMTLASVDRSHAHAHAHAVH